MCSAHPQQIMHPQLAVMVVQSEHEPPGLEEAVNVVASGASTSHEETAQRDRAEPDCLC